MSDRLPPVIDSNVFSILYKESPEEVHNWVMKSGEYLKHLDNIPKQIIEEHTPCENISMGFLIAVLLIFELHVEILHVEMERKKHEVQTIDQAKP